jgi:uncharacterized membrane protein YdbT with pleckstrin-like domain
VARGRRPALLDGEQLTVVLHRAWYTLFWPAVVLVLFTGLGAYGAGRVPDSGPQHALRWIIGGTAALIVLRWSFWPFLVWYSRSLRITDQRVILCDGLLDKRGTEVPLGRIIEVATDRSGLRRMFGAGRLTVRFAGGYAADLFPVPGAPGQGAVSLDDVPAVNAVHKLLLQLVAQAPRIAFLPPDPHPGSRR